MTLRACALVPPIVFEPDCVSLMPLPVLPRSSVPPAFRPIRLPRIVLFDAPLSVTPLPPLPEITLPSSASPLPSRLVPMVTPLVP